MMVVSGTARRARRSLSISQSRSILLMRPAPETTPVQRATDLTRANREKPRAESHQRHRQPARRNPVLSRKTYNCRCPYHSARCGDSVPGLPPSPVMTAGAAGQSSVLRESKLQRCRDLGSFHPLRNCPVALGRSLLTSEWSLLSGFGCSPLQCCPTDSAWSSSRSTGFLNDRPELLGALLHEPEHFDCSDVVSGELHS